jgi:di/tricarboxylate transporter
MKAMADTGIPDIFIGFMMGQPKTLRPAIVRMFFPVALLSGLFNNTPIVVMMIPLVMSFCQRLNLDHRALLMPLSYAAQAGGSLTLMGTSINFVAREVFAKGGFDIGFFTLTLGGIVIVVLDIVYCAIMGPIILAKKSDPEGMDAEDTQVDSTKNRARSMQEVQAELGKKNLFSVTVLVTHRSPLIGSAVQDCGIHRIKGVHVVHRMFRHGTPDDASMATVPVTGSAVQLEESVAQWQADRTSMVPDAGRGNAAAAGATVNDVEAAASQTEVGSQYHLIAEGWDYVSSTVVKSQDLLQVAGTSEGIAELRQVRGLVLGNEHTELQYLGGRRRQRVLCEAAVVPELVGKQIDIREWKSNLQCGVIGIRSMREPSLCRLSYNGYTIQAGDVLLIEAFKSMYGSDMWLDHFGVVRQVPGSKPPRNGRKADFLRAIFTGVGLLLVISLATLSSPILTMPVMCTIFLTGILITKGLTISEAYSEINAQVLFTIVGALGMGKAMQQTRLANCMAAVIVGQLQDLGPFAVLIGLYVATVGVGQFLNSAANVAIMGAIAIPIAGQMGMELGGIALVITYAASACYMAPYGYQTNTLVLKDSGYTWGDFIKFGGGLQFVHLLVVVSISQFCAQHAI